MKFSTTVAAASADWAASSTAIAESTVPPIGRCSSAIISPSIPSTGAVLAAQATFSLGHRHVAHHVGPPIRNLGTHPVPFGLRLRHARPDHDGTRRWEGRYTLFQLSAVGIRQPKLGYFPQPTWRTTWGPLSATWGRALCRLGYGSVMFDHDGGRVPVRLLLLRST